MLRLLYYYSLRSFCPNNIFVTMNKIDLRTAYDWYCLSNTNNNALRKTNPLITILRGESEEF